jgi:hypothetical protein
LVLM